MTCEEEVEDAAAAADLFRELDYDTHNLGEVNGGTTLLAARSPG